jgi:predicted DNA-binding transcriptional regulator YafY
MKARKKRGQVPMTRPPLRRIAIIDREIQAKRYPNSTTLAKRLEIHPRTIARDIEFMRDSQGAPRAFDKERNGYYYTDSTFKLPLINFRKREIAALYLASRVLGQYKKTPWEEDFLKAFTKIVGELPNEAVLDLARYDDALYFQTQPVVQHDIEVFKTLMEVISTEHQIQIVYHTYQRNKVSERVVDPYCMANVAGDWYLVAYCHQRKEIRVFSPSRIKSIKMTGEKFIRPAGFNAKEYFRPGFSAILGGREYKVKLRFSKDVARYLQEREWHPTQEIKERRNGSLEITLRVRGLDEIKRWVLSWGKDVEVIAPRKLVNIVKEEIKGIRYG